VGTTMEAEGWLIMTGRSWETPRADTV